MWFDHQLLIHTQEQIRMGGLFTQAACSYALLHKLPYRRTLWVSRSYCACMSVYYYRCMWCRTLHSIVSGQLTGVNEVSYSQHMYPCSHAEALTASFPTPHEKLEMRLVWASKLLASKLLASFPRHSHIFLYSCEIKIFEWPGNEAKLHILLLITLLFCWVHQCTSICMLGIFSWNLSQPNLTATVSISKCRSAFNYNHISTSMFIMLSESYVRIWQDTVWCIA